LIFAADYVVFGRRRRTTLKEYENGAPRLRTLSDHMACSLAWREAGLPEPSMSDWNEAAGFGNVTAWREDLRYRLLMKYYQGGDVADVGCNDGRLCWRYKICDPNQYTGIDPGEGLVEILTAKTGGRARHSRGGGKHHAE
jgi:hypothetical protein